MKTTKMRASATASLIALATMASLAAAPAATATPAATAQLAVDAPMTVPNAEGNNVIWFGSLQVKSGGTTTCLSLSNFVDARQVGTRFQITTDFAVTLGTSYDISAWESGRCDVYVPEWGHRTGTLGGMTATPTAEAVSNGVWRVAIP